MTYLIYYYNESGKHIAVIGAKSIAEAEKRFRNTYGYHTVRTGTVLEIAAS